MFQLRRLPWLLVALLACWSSFSGCAETGEPDSAESRFDEGSQTQASGHIEYEEGEPGVVGETPIRELLNITDPGADSGTPEVVWYGFAPDDAYPQGEDRSFDQPCDTGFGNRYHEVDQLPATIEGVVTLAPQHYEKVTICGQDHRFYGSYFLQDDSGSILVLRDSRISDFTYGDRVRLRVRGIVKQFGTMGVTVADEVEVERDYSATPYETLTESYASRFDRDSERWRRQVECRRISDAFAVPPGLGNNYRVTGRICQEPNNRNFNEMSLQPGEDECVDDPDFTWNVSLGLELGRRGLDLEPGQVVTATGPVFGQLVGIRSCEWTFRMQATTVGQFESFNR